MRGLIGKKLSHSYSKLIHEKIDQKNYNLIELDSLDSFFHEKRFKALNVTIPYKSDVIKHLDNYDDIVKETKACNTIINQDGALYGYNTDYYGFQYLCEYHNISFENKAVGILGNGSTSKTIALYSKHQNAASITHFARNPKETEYPFEALKEKHVDIIINATPVGMYPNTNDELPLPYEHLQKTEVIIDLIYNPLRTNLLLFAEEHNIKAVNGLLMLVHQAIKANELFNNTQHPKSLTDDIYKEIWHNTINIVLIGMPMSGKTYYARQVGSLYNKEVLDLDHEIEKETQVPIPVLFEKHGEQSFRKLENDICIKVSKSNNKAISTGGGVVTNPENIHSLKQNGVLVFLDMPLDQLKKCNPKNRPLLKDSKNLENLYNTRYNLYKTFCDVQIAKDGFKTKKTLHQIEVKIDEYFNTKRT